MRCMVIARLASLPPHQAFAESKGGANNQKIQAFADTGLSSLQHRVILLKVAKTYY